MQKANLSRVAFCLPTCWFPHGRRSKKPPPGRYGDGFPNAERIHMPTGRLRMTGNGKHQVHGPSGGCRLDADRRLELEQIALASSSHVMQFVQRSSRGVAATASDNCRWWRVHGIGNLDRKASAFVTDDLEFGYFEHVISGCRADRLA